MPRALDSGLESAIARAGTAPGWLIEIATTPRLRYSTRGTLDYGGYTWTGGATLDGAGASGLDSGARLGLPNTDNAASALALTELVRDVPVTVWAYYGDPRFDTNLISNGLAFNAATWNKSRVTVTADVETAPDGSATADALVESGVAGFHYAAQNVVFSEPAAHRSEVYVKAGTRGFAFVQQLTGSGTPTNIKTYWNLSTGAITFSSAAGAVTITDAGDGWWRVVADYISGTGTSRAWYVGPATTGANGSDNYTGTLGDEAIYVWGASVRRGTAAAYAEELATLTIDAVDAITATRVTLTLAGIAQAASHQPDVLIGPPLCRHIPPPGTRIAWGGDVYVLEE